MTLPNGRAGPATSSNNGHAFPPPPPPLPPPGSASAGVALPPPMMGLSLLPMVPLMPAPAKAFAKPHHPKPLRRPHLVLPQSCETDGSTGSTSSGSSEGCLGGGCGAAPTGAVAGGGGSAAAETSSRGSSTPPLSVSPTQGDGKQSVNSNNTNHFGGPRPSGKGGRRHDTGDGTDGNLTHDPRKYKTQMCRNWHRTGECIFGDACVYAHGEEELRNHAENASMISALSRLAALQPPALMPNMPPPPPLAHNGPLATVVAAPPMMVPTSSAGRGFAIPAPPPPPHSVVHQMRPPPPPPHSVGFLPSSTGTNNDPIEADPLTDFLPASLVGLGLGFPSSAAPPPSVQHQDQRPLLNGFPTWMHQAVSEECHVDPPITTPAPKTTKTPPHSPPLTHHHSPSNASNLCTSDNSNNATIVMENARLTSRVQSLEAEVQMLTQLVMRLLPAHHHPQQQQQQRTGQQGEIQGGVE